MTSMRVSLVLRQISGLIGALLLAGALSAQQPGPPPGPPQPTAQLLSPQQLDTLVAPVALYPDAFLGQVLAASTYPLEIVEAGQWLQAHSDLQSSQLMEAARQQNWDPSVQALVAFPDVLSRLNADIRYTTDLGNAFLAQQGDVMSAVQRMRSRAMASGKLRSGPQETVNTEMQGGQQAIDIQPANPEVAYVPYYDPEYVWGPPAYGYYPGWDYAGYGFGFFPGIYVGGFFGGLGWGGWGWGLNWFHAGLFLNPFFFNHCGFAFHGGGAAWGGRGVLWAHDAGHRLGIAYPNRALTSRYGAISNAHAAGGARFGQTYAGAHPSMAPRTSQAQAGGWSRFGQTNRGSSYSPQSSYRSSPYASGGAYRSSPSYGNSYGARTSPSYGYRSSPSYGGARSAPSYNRSAPSYSGGSRSGGSSHSSGGSDHSSSSGHSSGGFHGGGGGHGGGHR
jgi:hypothetical protein